MLIHFSEATMGIILNITCQLLWSNNKK